MTISEAYKKWSEEEDNRHFAIKTKAAFQQVWVNMDQSVDVTLVTLDMLRRAINRKAIRPDQASAASVMVHVLNYGRQQMGKKKPVPFEYNQILKSDEDTTRSAVPTTVSPKTTEATQPHKPEHASAPWSPLLSNRASQSKATIPKPLNRLMVLCLLARVMVVVAIPS